MPDLDDSAASAAGRTAPSRRSVLKGAAGVGAAGIAATTLAGIAVPAAAAASTSHSAAAPHEHDESAGTDIVVHVRDAASGELDVYHGTSHTKLHDRALAAHLARISR